MSDDIEFQEIQQTTNAMCALLADRESMVQGAILADLLSLWLAGHIIRDDAGGLNRAATDAVREDLLDFHIRMVRRFLRASDRKIRDLLKQESKT